MVARRTSNKEWYREWSRSRFGSTSASFPLLSSSSFSLLSIPSTSKPWTPSSASLAHLFIRKWALGAKAARPGELKLCAEVMSSPRRVCFFTMKFFGGPGEPKASLGELRSRKTKEKTMLPPFFGIFAFLIKTLNDHLFRTVTGIQNRKSTSKDQKINER